MKQKNKTNIKSVIFKMLLAIFAGHFVVTGTLGALTESAQAATKITDMDSFVKNIDIASFLGKPVRVPFPSANPAGVPGGDNGYLYIYPPQFFWNKDKKVLVSFPAKSVLMDSGKNIDPKKGVLVKTFINSYANSSFEGQDQVLDALKNQLKKRFAAPQKPSYIEGIFRMFNIVHAEDAATTDAPADIAAADLGLSSDEINQLMSSEDPRVKQMLMLLLLNMLLSQKLAQADSTDKEQCLNQGGEWINEACQVDEETACYNNGGEWLDGECVIDENQNTDENQNANKNKNSNSNKASSAESAKQQAACEESGGSWGTAASSRTLCLRNCGKTDKKCSGSGLADFEEAQGIYISEDATLKGCKCPENQCLGAEGKCIQNAEQDTDDDNDGVLNGQDRCPNSTPDGSGSVNMSLGAAEAGCTCSQLQAQGKVKQEQCPVSTCDGPYWTEYPPSGMDQCNNGVVIPYPCSPVARAPREDCNAIYNQQQAIQDALNNANNNKSLTDQIKDLINKGGGLDKIKDLLKKVTGGDKTGGDKTGGDKTGGDKGGNDKGGSPGGDPGGPGGEKPTGPGKTKPEPTAEQQAATAKTPDQFAEDARTAYTDYVNGKKTADEVQTAVDVARSHPNSDKMSPEGKADLAAIEGSIKGDLSVQKAMDSYLNDKPPGETQKAIDEARKDPTLSQEQKDNLDAVERSIKSTGDTSPQGIPTEMQKAGEPWDKFSPENIQSGQTPKGAQDTVVQNEETIVPGRLASDTGFTSTPTDSTGTLPGGVPPGEVTQDQYAKLGEYSKAMDDLKYAQSEAAKARAEYDSLASKGQADIPEAQKALARAESFEEKATETQQKVDSITETLKNTTLAPDAQDTDISNTTGQTPADRPLLVDSLDSATAVGSMTATGDNGQIIPQNQWAAAGITDNITNDAGMGGFAGTMGSLNDYWQPTAGDLLSGVASGVSGISGAPDFMKGLDSNGINAGNLGDLSNLPSIPSLGGDDKLGIGDLANILGGLDNLKGIFEGIGWNNLDNYFNPPDSGQTGNQPPGGGWGNQGQGSSSEMGGNPTGGSAGDRPTDGGNSGNAQ